MNLSEFAELAGSELTIRSRDPLLVQGYKLEPYYAKVHGMSFQKGHAVIIGNGQTPELAREDLLSKIKDQTVYVMGRRFSLIAIS